VPTVDGFRVLLAGSLSSAMCRCSRANAVPRQATQSSPKAGRVRGLLRKVAKRAQWLLFGKEKEWERQLLSAKEDVAIAEGKADSLRQTLAEENSLRRGVEEQLSSARSRLSAAEAEVRQVPILTAKIKELASKESDFKLAVAQAEEKVQKMQVEYTRMSDEYELQQNASNVKIADLAERLATTEKQLEQLRQSENNLMTQVQAAETKVRELLEERMKWLPMMFGLGDGEETDAIEQTAELSSKRKALLKVQQEGRDKLAAAIVEVEKAAAQVDEVAASSGAEAELSSAQADKPDTAKEEKGSALKRFLLSRLR